MYIHNTNLTYELMGYKYSDPSPTWVTSEKYYNCEGFSSPLKRKKLKLFRR